MSFDPRCSDSVNPGKLSLQQNRARPGTPFTNLKDCFNFDPVNSVDMEKVIQFSRQVNWLTEARGGKGRDMLRYRTAFDKTDPVKLVLSFGFNG